MFFWHSTPTCYKQCHAFDGGESKSIHAQIVATPMSLKKISRKLKEGEYPAEKAGIERFLGDLELIVSNCGQFNGVSEPLKWMELVCFDEDLRTHGHQSCRLSSRCASS